MAARAEHLWLYPGALCGATSAFLDEVYSEELALYPFTTSVVDGRYVSDYRLPGALRYTINTLLGRLRAGSDRVEPELQRLVGRYGSRLDPGDRGLLLVLLAELGRDLTDDLAAAKQAVAVLGVRRLNLQDLCWLVWGAARAAEAGCTGAEAFARELRTALAGLAGNGALARHVHSAARADLVSFGSTVYYLRALHEYARVFDDTDVRGAFERGVRAALGFQGRYGEWPWMISVSRAAALDVYPVYSVHQLAMAMLFLLPAFDDGVVEGVGDAIRRSYRWVLGENELSVPFGRRDPFIVFRSLERDEPLQKIVRFTRASLRSTLRLPAHGKSAGRTRINPEWRSYEGGWLLYAWGDRPDELVA